MSVANPQESDPNWRPQAARATEDAEEPIRVPPQNRSQPFAIIIFLMFMFFGGTSDDPLLAHDQLKSSLQSLRYQRANFTSWLNHTESNFTLVPSQRHINPLLDVLLPQIEPLDPQHWSYFQNTTGFIEGPAVLHNLSGSVPEAWSSQASRYFDLQVVNLTEVARDLGDWNWTSINKFTISILERREVVPGTVIIDGSMELQSPTENDYMRFQLEGVHFQENGTMFALIEPKGRHVDIRQVPSLVPESARDITSQAVLSELSRRIENLEKLIYAGSVEIEDNDDNFHTNCPFSFFAQLSPAPLPARLMEELEKEMLEPTGVSLPSRPQVFIDAVLLSKECGLVIEFKNAKGLKAETFWRKTTTYAGCAFAIYSLLVVLLVRHCKSTASSAAISKVSRWTFVVQALVDAVAFVTHGSFGIIAESKASLSLLGPGFMSCLLLINEAQYVLIIKEVQAAESTSFPSQPGQPAGQGTQTDAQTVLRRLGASFSNLYVWLCMPPIRYWLFILLGFTVFVGTIIWPSLSFWLIGILYSTIWVPQIIRSARRNIRKALSKRFVLGTSICRQFFTLYIFACPNNIVGADVNGWIWLGSAFMAMQVFVIFLQEYIGPAFFLPRGWLAEPAYDYHLAMAVPDSEAPQHSLGSCSICMDPILVHAESSGGKGSRWTAVAGRRSYSLAPCHHLFHTACLEQWLAIKSICPQCRRPLPPL